MIVLPIIAVTDNSHNLIDVFSFSTILEKIVINIGIVNVITVAVATLFRFRPWAQRYIAKLKMRPLVRCSKGLELVMDLVPYSNIRGIMVIVAKKNLKKIISQSERARARYLEITSLNAPIDKLLINHIRPL